MGKRTKQSQKQIFVSKSLKAWPRDVHLYFVQWWSIDRKQCRYLKKILIAYGKVFSIKCMCRTYDTDHRYNTEIMKENVCCIFISCQFIWESEGL